MAKYKKGGITQTPFTDYIAKPGGGMASPAPTQPKGSKGGKK